MCRVAAGVGPGPGSGLVAGPGRPAALLLALAATCQAGRVHAGRPQIDTCVVCPAASLHGLACVPGACLACGLPCPRLMGAMAAALKIVAFRRRLCIE